MKKIITSILLCTAMISAQAQEAAAPKLSARTAALVKKIELSKDNKLPRGYAYRKLADGKMYASALIKINNAAQAEIGLRNIRAKIGTRAGDIWTVQVPVNKILQFVHLQGIESIEMDQPARPELFDAKIHTRVDSVHGGYNLPMPYTGKDVVIGVIDFGFDYDNPAFYDTLGQKYRVKKAWELGTTGTPPAGYSYGHELADSNAIRAQGTDNPEQSHGTPVAGIAGGSGIARVGAYPDLYQGIAFESDFVFVGVRRDSIEGQWMGGTFTDFIDGINYIFNYANAVGKPAVVNISWGSHAGAHDGSSLFNQACNNLTGKGNIIVMSAGNDGGEKLHLMKTFSPTDSLFSTFLYFSDTVYQRTWVDIWGVPTKSFCVKMSLYRNGVIIDSTGYICTNGNSNLIYLAGSNGDTCIIDYSTSASEISNNKPHAFFDVYNKTKDSVVLDIKATDGSIHAWNESYYYGYTKGYNTQFLGYGLPGKSDGDVSHTTSEMGSADSVLLIGAYTTKKSWIDINGGGRQVNGSLEDIAPFSSKGPTADNRVKPDITAPGYVISSPTSWYDTSRTITGTNFVYVIDSFISQTNNKTYYYSQFSGTSASAPMASGIIALILQVKPDISFSELKNLLATTAITDFYTGNIPPASNTWGHGKINAYGAIKKLLQTTGNYEYQGQKLDCILYPNPNNGDFTLDYTGKKNEPIRIQIFDITGKLMSTQSWQVQEGKNRKDIRLHNLSKGIYFIKLTSATGSVSIKTTIQ